MNYISLGYFCSVALELEKLGLRTESSPFDWVISDFEGVLLAIEDHFADFLKYEYLAQSTKNRDRYKNTKYNISFFHDFDKYIPLYEQLPKFQEKYDRRIKRFYKSITEPTLFIRYISDEETVEGVSKELGRVHTHVRARRTNHLQCGKGRKRSSGKSAYLQEC